MTKANGGEIFKGSHSCLPHRVFSRSRHNIRLTSNLLSSAYSSNRLFSEALVMSQPVPVTAMEASLDSFFLF